MDGFPHMELFTYDSPPYKSLGGFFNWTMTYRRDSDFHVPYGIIIPKNWDQKHYNSPQKTVNWQEYFPGDSYKKQASYNQTSKDQKSLERN